MVVPTVEQRTSTLYSTSVLRLFQNVERPRSKRVIRFYFIFQEQIGNVFSLGLRLSAIKVRLKEISDYSNDVSLSSLQTKKVFVCLRTKKI